jgi:hypothetical protein
MECARAGIAEPSAAAFGGAKAVAIGDEILVLTLLLFAVIALFIFSAGES